MPGILEELEALDAAVSDVEKKIEIVEKLTKDLHEAQKALDISREAANQFRAKVDSRLNKILPSVESNRVR